MKRLIILFVIVAAFYWHWSIGLVTTAMLIVWSWFRAERHGMSDDEIAVRWAQFRESEKSKTTVNSDGEIDWESVKL